MNKLGYKQKGIPMLKSPLNVEDGLIMRGIKGAGSAQSAQSVQNRRTEAGNFTMADRNASAKQNIKFNPGSIRPTSTEKFPEPITGQSITGRLLGTKNLSGSSESPPPPPKVKTSFKDAYAKRDMKTYGNLSQAEYTTEAKRQLKGGKVPGSQMEGGNAAKVVKTEVIKNKISDENSSSFAGEGEQPGFTNTQSTKTTEKKPAAKIKSNKDIRKEKRANIKGGMSRQEARLKKTQSKAASAKAKTNSKSAAIDATNSSKSYKAPKEESVRRSKAKSIRLQKRAERLKGRVNASKISK